MYVQSRDLESRWFRRPSLCAGRWHESSPGHQSPPAAEWRRSEMASRVEH